jgi:hypothetical protein
MNLAFLLAGKNENTVGPLRRFTYVKELIDEVRYV